MNIFYIDKDPRTCAEQMVDKHVVKMILETAQLLSTAHRMIDGVLFVGKTKTGRNVKRWRLDDPKKDETIYQATHVNHPSAVWCRASNNNYNWLFCHFEALLTEYTYRYGKVHKCAELVPYLREYPKAIHVGYFTPVTPAMPDEYKVEHDSVASYRNYYRIAKERMHKWTKRPTPEWLVA